MLALRSFLAVLRFALELALVAVYGLFGFGFGSAFGGGLGVALSWVLGLGLPAFVILMWGLYVAPRAPRRSSDPTRFALEIALFFSGAALLAAMSMWELGFVLFVLFVLDRWLLDRLGQPAWAEPNAR